MPACIVLSHCSVVTATHRCQLSQFLSHSIVKISVNIGVMHRLQTGWLENRVQFLTMERDFSLYHSIQTSYGAHPACYTVGTWVLSLRLRWLGCDDGRASSGKAKIAWSYTSYLYSPLHLHGVVLTLPLLLPLPYIITMEQHAWVGTYIILGFIVLNSS